MADHVVVTLALGVLQAERVRFVLEVPHGNQQAIANLEGFCPLQMNRIVALKADFSQRSAPLRALRRALSPEAILRTQPYGFGPLWQS